MKERRGDQRDQKSGSEEQKAADEKSGTKS
jgi:hypothetical protein